MPSAPNIEPRVLAEPAVDRFVDVREAAGILCLSVTHMNKMRVRGGGPRFSTFGPRAVRYRMSDLFAWAEERVSTSTSERKAA